MNFEQLTYFAEVARQEHVTKAARALRISPSAVSHAVTRLENELGQPLFRRDGRRIFLTPYGRLLAERVQSILRSVTLLHQELKTDVDLWLAHYRLAASHGLASELLVPSWLSVSRDQGDARADVTTMRTADLVRSVSAAEVDYAIGYAPLDHPDVTTETLVEGRLVVVVRAGHPILVVPPKARPQELSRYAHASVKAFFGTATCEDHPTLVAWNVVRAVPLYFDSYDVARSYLVHSDAWAVMPEWTVSLLPGPPLAVAAVLGAEKLTRIAALWPKSRPPPEPLVRLHDAVRSRLATLQTPGRDSDRRRSAAE